MDQNNKKNKVEKTFVNYNIRGTHVRVIFDNQPAKILSIDDAINLAESQNKDLVQISYDKTSRLAVCKIIDYGKFKYEQQKREKNAKRQARANEIDIKTVQFSIMTDDNDKQRLIKQALKFLDEKDKVKISIRFRNKRESQNVDYAKTVMKDILSNFEYIADLDSVPSVSGREFSCVLRPKK